ncbi:hypothetical protein C0J52_26828 [Blattella germanica]|nr:hypothetical protein C0J52_26828 [Blattella germanica]
MIFMMAVMMTVTFMIWYSNKKQQEDLLLEESGDIQPIPTIPVLSSLRMESIMLEMKQRQLTVMDECHDSGRFKVDNILSQSNVVKVVYKLFINRKHRLAWCPIYKAGSSTWMYAFAAMSGILTPENLSRYKKGNIQMNYLAKEGYPQIKTRKQLEENLKDVTRFIIVRHPFERILSAFRDKLEHRKDREFYYKRYGRQIVKTQRTGNNTQAEPTFEEFLKFIVHARSFDEHWRPYYVECAPCELDYQFILKMEELNEEQTYFVTKFNLQEFLPSEVYKNPTGRTRLELSKKYYSQVSRNLLAKVYQIYEFDFRLFNYSPTEYFDFARDKD